MRAAYVKKFLAALALTAATLCAQEKLPDERAPLAAQPAATPTSLPGAETYFYRTGAPAPCGSSSSNPPVGPPKIGAPR